MSFNKVVQFVFVLALFSSCKLQEKEAPIPAYIYIKPGKLVTNSDNSQGAASMKVEDVWVFDNESARGIYKVNSLVPIQREGKTFIRVSNGIRPNGMAEERLIYPMFTSFSKEYDLKPNEVDTVEPTFAYVGNTVFPLIEDFDGNGIAFEYAPGKAAGDTILKVKSDSAWNPSSLSGRVHFESTESSKYIEIYSQVFNNWPGYTPFYLEMDYRGNLEIIVGLYATITSTLETSQFAMYATNPKSDWNKLYLNLQDEITSRNVKNGNMQYRIFIRINRGDVSVPDAWIDNIKVVYLD